MPRRRSRSASFLSKKRNRKRVSRSGSCGDLHPNTVVGRLRSYDKAMERDMKTRNSVLGSLLPQCLVGVISDYLPSAYSNNLSIIQQEINDHDARWVLETYEMKNVVSASLNRTFCPSHCYILYVVYVNPTFEKPERRSIDIWLYRFSWNNFLHVKHDNKWLVLPSGTDDQKETAKKTIETDILTNRFNWLPRIHNVEYF